MITNRDITVINESDGIYFGECIRGVSCIGKTARTATEIGLVSADYFTIRIMESLVSDYGSIHRSFLQDEHGGIFETESGYFLELENSGHRFIFLPQKTMIAIGEVKDTDLKDIKSFLRMHEVYTVVSVGDNRHGTSAVRHWRIDCK